MNGESTLFEKNAAKYVKDRSERLEKKTVILKKLMLVARIITGVLLAAVLVFSGYLTEALFSYDVISQKTREVPYDVSTSVSTFVCYTTTYSSCYHAKHCASLWNSAVETTVYEAKQKGYSACSKCTPRKKTTLALTETRYKTEQYSVRETKTPSTFIIWLGCTATVIACYFFLTLPVRIMIRKNNRELEAIAKLENEYTF